MSDTTTGLAFRANLSLGIFVQFQVYIRSEAGMDISPEFFPRVLAILFVCFLLLGFALVVRMTAKDARRRGKSPVLVTLLVLISFPLGLIVWLLFRPEPINPEGPPFRLKDYRVQ